MGLLSGIKKVASSVGKAIEKNIIVPAGNLAAKGIVAVANPIIKTLGGTPQKVTPQTSLGTSKTAEAYRTALGGAAIAAAVTSIPSTAYKAAGAAIGKQAMAHPVQTAAAGLIGIPLVAGALVSEPKLITELPEKSFALGEGLVDTIREHPVAAGIIGSVAGGVAAYEIGKNVFGDNKDDSIETQTKAITKAIESRPSISPPSAPGAASIESASPIPSTFAAPVGALKESKKRKRAKKEPIRISQRVNVAVSQRNSYINRKVYKQQLLYN